MSEMVDRVAKAMVDFLIMQDPTTPSWRDADEAMREAMREAVRPQIEAMRDPTDAMEKAGAAKWDDDWCTQTNAMNMWQAMIDEALK